VSDVYYRKKCSSGAAAVDILDQYIDLGIKTEDEEGKAQAKKLATEYRNVPEKYLLTLVQVTGSSAQASDEMASLLSGYFAKNPYTQRLDLTHRITPLPYEDLEGPPGNTTTPGGKARIPVSGSPSRLSPTPTAFGADLPSTIQRINVSNQARRDAESYASQLSRRGASNSLYRQAAAVYRERGHDHARHAQQLTSTAAKLLVESQSTPTSIDLHGVTVRDGTRIARDKVQIWWDNLGEFRSRKAREQPFTVITGLGRHSAGGVSQLRQAVAAALLQDGWKMRVETGKFVVSGRR
jgi:DNA-nicking Smr family endonuclease